MIDDTTYRLVNGFLAPLPFVYLNKAGGEVGNLEKLYRLERVDYTDGIKVWFTDAQYPMNGFPLGPIDMKHLDQTKRFLILSVKTLKSCWLSLLFTWDKIGFIRTWLKNYNEVANKGIEHLYLNEKYMTPVARGVKQFVSTFLSKLGIEEDFALVLSHITNYDDAYRLRLQDLVSETSPWMLKRNPRKELKRLLNLLLERDSKGVGEKTGLFVKILLLALFIPKVKDAFLWAVDHTSFEDMNWTEADWYFAALRTDYQFGGLSHEERSRDYKKPKEFTNV